jgi:hypothetical protein
MASLGTVLAIVLGVNIMLWMGQVAVLNLNPSGPTFYSCKDSMIGSFEASNCQSSNYVLNDANVTSQLPTGGSTINVGNGNVFTDTFSAISSWFTRSTGINYVYNILAAPANFLKAIGVPDEFSFAVGAFWYGFTLLVIVAFFFGRDY